jgi:hypothetical protein
MPPVFEADSLAHTTLNLHCHRFPILVIAAIPAGLFAPLQEHFACQTTDLRPFARLTLYKHAGWAENLRSWRHRGPLTFEAWGAEKDAGVSEFWRRRAFPLSNEAFPAVYGVSDTALAA